MSKANGNPTRDVSISDYPGYSEGEWRNRFTTGIVEWEDPDSILANEWNHRIHTRMQQEQVESLLQTFGWIQTVGISHATGRCIDGHLRIILAIRHNTKVPVLYLDLTEAEERAALASLDYTASQAGIDLNILATNVEFMQVEFPALEVVWENLKVDFELAGEKETQDAEPQLDRAKELQEKWQVQPGELFEIGAHRLICGDCTDAAIVARVMGGERADCVMADPPYGMNLDTDYSGIKGSANARIQGKGGRKYAPVIGDDEDYDPRPVMELFDCKEQFWFGADYYAERIPNKNDGSWIVWDKRGSEDADKIIGASFELCWSKVKHKRDIARIKWMGAFGYADARERAHPTQKPEALIEWILGRHTNDGEIIIDPYLGSGTTLVACENLSRRGRGIEISPAYCAVILERMAAAFPELTIRRVNVA